MTKNDNKKKNDKERPWLRPIRPDDGNQNSNRAHRARFEIWVKKPAKSGHDWDQYDPTTVIKIQIARPARDFNFELKSRQTAAMIETSATKNNANIDEQFQDSTYRCVPKIGFWAKQHLTIKFATKKRRNIFN